MEWFTQKELESIAHVWPWLATLFLIAFLITLVSIPSWKRLWIGLKSHEGNVPALPAHRTISIALVTLLFTSWLLNIDLTLVLIGIVSLMIILASQNLHSLGWWPPSLRNLTWGIAMGLSCVFVFWIFHGFMTLLWMALNLPYQEQLAVKLFFESKSTAQVLNLIFTACVVAPILEEFAFRGAIYPTLKSLLGEKIALLFSSALFAIAHDYWVGALPLMMLGVLLVIIYERTGSLWSCVGFHIGFNLMNTTQLLILKIGLDQFQ